MSKPKRKPKCTCGDTHNEKCPMKNYINDISPKPRQITPEEFAKGLGAEPVSPEKEAEMRRKLPPI